MIPLCRTKESKTCAVRLSNPFGKAVAANFFIDCGTVIFLRAIRGQCTKHIIRTIVVTRTLARQLTSSIIKAHSIGIGRGASWTFLPIAIAVRCLGYTGAVTRYGFGSGRGSLSVAASIGDGVVGDGDGSSTAGRFVGDLVGLPVFEEWP